MTDPPVDILLVEDKPSHARLAKEALQAAQRPHRVFLVADGPETMAFLRRQGNHVDAPRPQLILLNLNLPRNDDWAMLAEIKTDDRLKQIPVVVLGNSRAKKDIARAYDLKANCYVPKPPDLEALRATLQGIVQFWMATVSLPHR